MPDLISEILSDAKAEGVRPSIFEKWMADNPEPSALFWDVMTEGYGNQGIPFARVLKSWSKHFPEAPANGNQSIKKMVDARLNS